MIRKPFACTLLLLCLLTLLPSLAAAADLGFERARMKDVLATVVHDVEKHYYDPAFHGLQWKALVQQARDRIDKAQSAGEMITAIFILLNQLQDSHTVFLPPGRVAKPLFGFEAKAYGDKIYVYEVEKDGAAEKAGLKRGDQVLTINGFNARRADFDTMMLFFRALRPQTVLKLQLLRDGQPQELTVAAKMKTSTNVVDLTDEFNIWTLIRESETSTTYHYNTYDDQVGYLQLPEFNVSDESGFLKGLVKKVSENKAFIVDLRGNPGGTVNTLERFSGFFDSQPTVIAQVVGRKTEDMKIRPQKLSLSGPMFILVDSQTASAAEIFARHFQRIGRAKVIGDHTSGRVTAARFFPESAGIDTVVPYGIEITIGHVIFPGGEDLESKGITPDELCIPTAEQVARDADPCFHIARAMARKALGLPEPLEQDLKEGKKE